MKVFLCSFAVMAGILAGGLSPAFAYGVRIAALESGRTITPNGDGINDLFKVRIENPQEQAVTGRVLDTLGREVGELRISTDGLTLSWDGREISGDAAPAGAYIYQIQASGSRANGLVVVAR